MSFQDALSFGLPLALAGLAFWLAVRLYVRRLTHLPVPASAPSYTEPLQDHGDAILVITGGKVIQANNRARVLFHLGENEQPNLDRLARRTRPADLFYRICAEGQQAQLVLDGRLVKCTSYRLSVKPNPLVVVSLADAGITSSLAAGQDASGGKNLQTIMALNQAMTSSLDLATTVRQILSGIQKLVPADWMQITVWDEKRKALIPYRMTGGAGEAHGVEILPAYITLEEGLTGRLARSRESILAEDISRSEERILDEQSQGLLRAYLGVPLVLEGDLVGTLELASLNAGAFRLADLEVIRMLAGQAAAVVRNARTHQLEQKKLAELSGLAQLSQAFGSARDPRTLFTNLVESILPLIQVEMLGFLLYNENQRTLEGQAPFHGLPEQFLDMYRIPVPSNSALERVLLSQEVLTSENAASDRQWELLGLGPMGRGASLRETVLIPLSSGGRVLGYLQASNHIVPGQAFTPEEMHLLTIVANQAAPVIDNLLLLQQSRQRAQRAESLRRVASLASSAANLDEILKFSLQELARLLGADRAAIFLIDPASGQLQIHAGSVFGGLKPLPARTALRMDDAQFHFTVTGSQRALNTGSMSEEGAIIPFYQGIQSHWKVESVVAVPLVVRDQGIGELWLVSSQVNFFDRGSQQVAVTAAGQLAGVVEQSYLVAQTDANLRRRSEQLTALTRISRELSTSVDLRYLLQLVYDEAIATTRADCGTIVLFDLSRPTPGGPRMRFYIGDAPAGELSDQERQALASGETVYIHDTDQAGIQAGHEGVRSLLIVPVVYQQKQAGLMILHARTPNHFDPTAVEITQTLAVQAAVVLGNAIQYEEQAQQDQALKRELDTLAKLFDISRGIQPDLPAAPLLDAVTAAICAATPFQMAVASLYEAESGLLSRVSAAGLPEETWAELKAHRQPWQAVNRLLQPEYRIGSAYYIPADRRPAVPAEMHTITLLPELEKAEANAWDAHDLLLIPLLDRAGEPLGLISVDAPRDGRQPDWQTFQALDLFALQAAVLLQSSRHASGIQANLDALKAETDQLAAEAGESRQSIPQMRRKEQEQAATIEMLQSQVERVHHGLEVAEQANRQPDKRAVLRSVARELMGRFDMQAALIAERTPAGASLIDVDGSIPANANPEALFGARNPLRQAMQDGDLLLVSDLESEPAWRNCSLLKALGARSFVAVPLPVHPDLTMAVLVVSSEAQHPYSEADRQAFTQVARQVSVTLQKLDLLEQARRRLQDMDILVQFSRRLGSFNPPEILCLLVESARQILPAAQAGWAGLWDERNERLMPMAALGYADDASMTAITFTANGPGDNKSAGLPLPLRGLLSGQPLRAQEVQFARDYALPAEDLLHYRRASGGKLPVSNMVIPIRLGERALGVLVLENFNAQAGFSEDDENLILSLAQQAALALENAALLQAAQRRAVQLQALTSVAGAITSTLSSEELIASLLEQLGAVLPYDTASLWLRRGNSLEVMAARGFEDNAQLVGVSVSVDDSGLFREMASSGQPIYVPDVRQDERFPSLVEPERISWLGIPLVVQAELIGVIAVDKVEGEFYSEEHIQAARTFAGQAAVGLENARLFEESQRRAVELDQRSQRLGLLNRLSADLSASLDVNYILRLTCQELISALGISRVGTVLVDEKGRYFLEEEVPPGPDEMPLLLPESALFNRLYESRGIFNTSDVAAEVEAAPVYHEYLKLRKTRSLLAVPLLTGNNLHGWLLLQSEGEYRFSLPEIELASTIANQAAAAIQNARLFAETRRLTQDLEKRVRERTSEVTREHHNSQTLLSVITELSASLDMDLVLNRTLSVLNDAIGAEQSLIVLSQGSGKIFKSGADIVGLKTEAGRTASRMDQEIARWVTRRRTTVLVDDVWIDHRWGMPDDTLRYRSVLAVPLILGEDVLGSLLLFNRKPAVFSNDQVQMVEAAARQISIAINNADLFNLIRDQAEHLGGMLREQQIEASRSRAILEAVADGVLVTDAAHTIYLFNASAGRILDLDSGQMLGKPLDQFSGLFGKAGITWMQTIRTWTEDAESFEPGETYAERLELDNGRVVEVHLAPVFLRSEFLGTVSIFRDVTHEVQIDRLKSEFVANVSHELRTPMTSIKGYVDIMLMGAAGDLDPRQLHFLQIVKSNTERLSILVNDLLDVSKIDSGRVALMFQALRLQEIASEVVNDLNRRSRDENKPIHFVLDIPDDLPRVKGDLERVRQVLASLVSNGYNYTPVDGQVMVRMRANETHVQVDIVDNGIGIGTAEQKRIFERFYRGEDPLVLATAGTGLGLAITRSLVEMHGGKIWFTSSGVRGEGSTFSFTLPIFSLTLEG